MDQFKINNYILFASDTKGVAVINNKDNTHYFFGYPEAAVWAVLSENHEELKSRQMLQSILGSNEEDALAFINSCIEKWRYLNLIC
jgi:hypothetical protein